MYGKNFVQENLRYKNKSFNILILKNFEKNILNITHIPSKNFKYWGKYLRSYCKELGYYEYEVFKTNKCIFNQIDSVSSDTNLTCDSFPLDEYETIFCK